MDGSGPSGAREGRLGTLFITTTKRSTGKPRRNPLFYLDDGPNLVVVASNAGAARDPGWWRNLQVDPRAMVDLTGKRFAVLARRATGEESERMWPRFIAANPDFASYRELANRDVPLIVLEVTEPG